jgi:hypothetical protein
MKTTPPTTTILCEIVGAQNLAIREPVEPLYTFCRVQHENKILHATNVVSGTNPIWTVTSKCLFLLPESKFGRSSSKVTVEVCALKHYNMNSSSHDLSDRVILGSVQLDTSTILSHCDGKRLELPLKATSIETTSKTHLSTCTCTLAIRFRIAQPSDQQILQLLESSIERKQLKKEFLQHILHDQEQQISKDTNQLPLANLVTETSETEIVQSGLYNMVNNIFTASTVYDTNSYRELKRVKPHPDPKRPNETEFMSGSDIRKRTYEQSQSWVQAGSGQLGKLFVEVLACHDLPNLDLGEVVGDYTDPFVCLVYEDTVAMTDVIDDELNPRWVSSIYRWNVDIIDMMYIPNDICKSHHFLFTLHFSPCTLHFLPSAPLDPACFFVWYDAPC